MKHAISIVALSLLIPTLAQAQENLLTEEIAEEVSTEPQVSQNAGVRYACSKGEVMRRVEVEYETNDSTLPCSVLYYKDTEIPGYNATLWRAESTDGFCESKAAEFVNKLKNSGWSCTAN